MSCDRKRKKLNLEIKRIDAEHRKAQDEANLKLLEDNADIAEKKRSVNETEVEAKLHI